jgi:hypothetical protein
MTELCFKFSMCSIFLQMTENEFLQNQICVPKAKYENACVIENEDISGGGIAFMDALKFMNACISLIAGLFIYYLNDKTFVFV